MELTFGLIEFSVLTDMEGNLLGFLNLPIKLADEQKKGLSFSSAVPSA